MLVLYEIYLRAFDRDFLSMGDTGSDLRAPPAPMAAALSASA